MKTRTRKYMPVCLAMLAIWLNPSAFGEMTTSTPPPSTARVADNPLHTREGTDPSFAELLDKGVVTPGERWSSGPVLGSRIHVNHALLEKQTGKIGPIPRGIALHTQVSGANIGRKNFPKWTRWYQENQGVQVFRIFKDEQNIRGGAGDKGSPGRIEACAKPIKLAPGAWAEWEGTFTIAEPIGGCIFQLMHEGSLWPMHIDMSADGGIHFLRRRDVPGKERRISLGTDMVGKSLSIKVRSNGEDFEVYRKDPLDDGDWQPVATGTGPKAKDNKIQFRWGIYCGSKKGEVVPKDGMLFVTGVTIQ